MSSSAYGLWPLVIINSLVFIIFAFSFVKPKTSRDWRSFGAFSAFIIALFTEMYGFPLTIYLLSGWLATKFPGVDFLSHNSGHLFEDFFGWGGDPHFGPFHIASYILIFAGFSLLANAWKILHEAQRKHALATIGRDLERQMRELAQPQLDGRPLDTLNVHHTNSTLNARETKRL
jgi:protein-S-isoprenylcysteine O-methyltransferase Ste14